MTEITDAMRFEHLGAVIDARFDRYIERGTVKAHFEQSSSNGFAEAWFEEQSNKLLSLVDALPLDDISTLIVLRDALIHVMRGKRPNKVEVRAVKGG
jgi:hypothetical protein